MAKIISIGTAVPAYCHQQSAILQFMQKAYKLGKDDSRKLAYLYNHSDIDKRYSIVKDFSVAEEEEWNFIPANATSKSLNDRLDLYDEFALPLSLAAIHDCLNDQLPINQITHLITVSCTGMTAPGLDLQITEALNLPANVFRTSVNFMGCYAAIHALKLAKLICDGETNANVVIVCTEICTIHFQQEFTLDNAASGLLFGDGSAAVLVSNLPTNESTLKLKSFYSEVSHKGKNDMSWKLSDHGFLMKLSAYIPELIQLDIKAFVGRALAHGEVQQNEITDWCIHPGGKKILEVIKSQLQLEAGDIATSKAVLWNNGNMSSPTILFVLKEMMKNSTAQTANVFGVAFGPGLTMESFIAIKA